MVGSTTAPPVAVFSSFGKEVLITETTKQQQAPSKPLNFLASTNTETLAYGSRILHYGIH